MYYHHNKINFEFNMALLMRLFIILAFNLSIVLASELEISTIEDGGIARHSVISALADTEGSIVGIFDITLNTYQEHQTLKRLFKFTRDTLIVTAGCLAFLELYHFFSGPNIWETK